MHRGQISIEYLIIIGIAIGILIPGILLFYSYTNTNNAEAVSARINEIGLSIVATAKETYALGAGARRSLEFTMPEDVTRVQVNGTEIIFSFNTPFGTSEAVYFSSVNLTTSYDDGNISVIHPGLTKYRFTSQGQRVFVNET